MRVSRYIKCFPTTFFLIQGRTQYSYKFQYQYEEDYPGFFNSWFTSSPPTAIVLPEKMLYEYKIFYELVDFFKQQSNLIALQSAQSQSPQNWQRFDKTVLTMPRMFDYYSNSNILQTEPGKKAFSAKVTSMNNYTAFFPLAIEVRINFQQPYTLQFVLKQNNLLIMGWNITLKSDPDINLKLQKIISVHGSDAMPKALYEFLSFVLETPSMRALITPVL